MPEECMDTVGGGLHSFACLCVVALNTLESKLTLDRNTKLKSNMQIQKTMS